MSISAFPNREQPPTPEQIAAILGSRRFLWESITAFLSESYGASEELKYYGKSYGWMVQYRRGGKLLVSLYPKSNGLVAQVVLPEPVVEAILAQPIGEKTRLAIEAANQYAEGRWIYLDVWTDHEVEDLRTMIMLKTPPPTKRRTSTQHSADS